MTPALEQLDAFARALSGYQGGTLRAAEFCAAARANAALLAALPPRYTEVLEGVLMRIQSTASFDQESCSFSSADLVKALDTWATKARALLQSPTAPPQ